MIVLLQSCSDLPDQQALSLIDNPPPIIEVLSPGDNFVIGSALDLGQALPAAETVTVSGLLRLPQSASDPQPQISINQQSLTPTLVAANICQTPENTVCYSFSHDFSLSKGSHQFDIQVIDGKGKQYSRRINGAVDYCRIGGKDSGVAAEFQDDLTTPQGNRCHEIDGCSVYIAENDPFATSSTRNDPMAASGNTKAVAGTAFGAGTLPISEYFVHGQQPHDALPCNLHDVCYQSTATTQSGCDSVFHSALLAVCATAYPGNNPYPANSLDNGTWEVQKRACIAFADSYYGGVAKLGKSVFDQHKIDYKP